MSEAPDRIWLDGDTEVGDCPSVRGPFEDPKYASEPAIEYIRKDLSDAQITALQAENARLREAIHVFADAADEADEWGFDDQNAAPVSVGDCRAARAALAQKGGK